MERVLSGRVPNGESSVVAGEADARIPARHGQHPADRNGGILHPGAKLLVAAFQRHRPVFDATLSLRRHELSPAGLRRMLVRYPLMTARVVARIHWEAMRLWLKGARGYPHPGAGGRRGDAADTVP